MINNRQAGRRRGRGGQRSQGNPGRPDNGNRIDNRARGNAAQLLEKYKNLAREAQMQGDRVNTEYYLQFADHYFRVLGENRARFEDQRRSREDQFDGDEDEDFEGEAMADDRVDGNRGEQRYGNGRDGGRDGGRESGRDGNRDQYREDRRPPRDERRFADTPRVSSESPAAPVEAQAPLAAEGEDAPRRRRNRRASRAETGGEAAQHDEAEAPAAIEADRLPPALGVGESESEAEPKPRRRRTRAPATEASAAE
ncbi:MAG: hypothetical protein A4S16_02235 [Proteobacteria bacterium SG_bin6]|nr:MAG: hypothetical protein A4S16_02235 [Proteobacteria bacterium SG_bin6]